MSVSETNMNSFGKGRKVALITGITGQDGSYLTEFLLEKQDFHMFLYLCFRVHSKIFNDICPDYINSYANII